MSRHVLFVHQNFPAQFGHIAQHLAEHHDYRCTFVCEKPPGRVGHIERIQYQIRGGATRQTHYCSRTFENAIWHTHAVFEALQARPDIRPDLIVGHSGFGSTLFLRELYDCPIINYLEFYYHAAGTDMDFRPDFPNEQLNRLRAKARNAMLLLDLENCNLGYAPTHWQRDLFPDIFRDKIRVIFDGVDTNVWKPQANPPRVVNGRALPDGMRLVTYATRGMESMRGFDIFMRMAKRLSERRSDVLFLIAGEDRVCYGGDLKHTGGISFKEWVLSQDEYDLSRFVFLGLIPPIELARLFAISDVHVYLTVPFVLSWSLMNALACGTTVIASDTPPVKEMIQHGENGLLTDFFDVEALTDMVEEVLNRPDAFAHLGQKGARMIQNEYSLEVCLPQMVKLYEDVLSG